MSEIAEEVEPMDQLEDDSYFNIKEENLLEESYKRLQEESREEISKLLERNLELQNIVMNQSKLIELQTRLDLVKSGEDADNKEIMDLTNKIQLSHDIIQEHFLKFAELNNNKRREVLSIDNDRKSAIWDNFNQNMDPQGNKYYSCNYCERDFPCNNFTLAKCKEHLFSKCTEAPPELRNRVRIQRSDHNNRSHTTNAVWHHFVVIEKDKKNAFKCTFCDKIYLTRNATKCREHLAFKCQNAPNDVKQKFKETFSDEYLNSMIPNKKVSIWEHYETLEEDGDKLVIKCLYCGMNYANRNATKCREHLLDRCDKIPIGLRTALISSLTNTPTKTWTQIKIPIKDYFTEDVERKVFCCKYCNREYTTKNVTKFRLHLIDKCQEIPGSDRKKICEYTVSQKK